MTGDEHPHVFVTDDYGATWAPIASDLPANLFVRSIREDPKVPNLLYAGTRRGVFVSFDRGRHWSALRLNMPATAIYDLQIQPDANDLVVGSHGRGVWVLDDLRPLQEWASTRGASAVLFPPRDAYRMWRTSPVNSFFEGSMPDGDFIGENRPYGATFTYYLAHAAKKVTIDVVDAAGHVIRHLTGKKITRRAGLNRANWDLAEEGPTRWKSTFEQNRGPESGAEAVPGTYTLRLHADGVTKDQPVLVKADPRDTSPAEDAQKRHAFLAEVNGELGAVNTMLNAIDVRLKRATPAQAAALVAFKHRLTMDPANIEDLKTPVQVRERLLDLLGRVGSSSYQPPTPAQEAEGAVLRAQTQALSAAYAEFKAGTNAP